MTWKNLDWRTTPFFIGIHLLLVVALLAKWVDLSQVALSTWIFAIAYWIVSTMAVTGGYHRCISHKSYQAGPLLKLWYLFWSTASGQGSARKWCTDHRRHHRFVDSPSDPYNIKQGFFWAHMGWIISKDNPEFVDMKFSDIDNDPMIRFQHKVYIPVFFVMAFVVPGLVSQMLVGSFMEGFWIGGVMRMVWNYHCVFLVNSACHVFGTQPYSDKHSARDSHFLALFTFGEGYHNFHHQFQYDYRNGVKWHHWDPTKWWINLCAALGLAKDLRRVEHKEILRAKLTMDQNRLVSEGVWSERFAHLRMSIEHAHENFKKSVEEYRRLQHEKDREICLKLKSEIRRAKREFKRLQSEWRLLIQMPHLAAVS